MDLEQSIMEKATELITFWGIMGTIVSAFAGPTAIQKVIKPFFPVFIVGERRSKRRRLTFITISALITYGSSYYCLSREYTEGVWFIAAMVVLFQASIVEWVFTVADKRNPRLASRLSQGVWIDDDATTWDKTQALLLGKKKDQRKVKADVPEDRRTGA